MTQLRAGQTPSQHPVRALPLVCAVMLAAAACAMGTPTGSADGALKVVAAENFWGSIAAQLGGTRASVTSIITSPDTDPHDYEPRAQDGRAVASASYVIVNGVGYDPWASKLLAASGGKTPTVLDVGRLVGAKAGDNPHRWYFPSDVIRVVDQITTDYKRLDPGDAAYFDEQRSTFEATGLKRYNDLIAKIRQAYAGTPVGASESIFTPLAQALGLALLTPTSFLDAISEGGEPTAQDKATVDAQLKSRQVEVYVFNSQNATPDVKAQVKLAQASGIPVASVTETLTPAKASFQDWQVAQLQALADALAKGTAA